MQIGQSRRVGFGRQPAIIVVDMTRGLTDRQSPKYAPEATPCLNALLQLLAAARELAIPRIFTRGGLSYFTNKNLPLSAAERGAWAYKNPLHDSLTDASLWDLAPELEIGPGEIIIDKTKSSAFFGTPLIAYLTHLGVDTVIIGGMLTSGCVRCTAVDAYNYNLRVIMPLEGMADKRATAHEIHVEDLDLKYGDVMPVADILAVLRSRYVKAIPD